MSANTTSDQQKPSSDLIQQLGQPLKKKILFARILGLVGIGAIILAIISFAQTWTVDWLSFTLEYEHEDKVINYSFIIGTLLIAFGGYLISRLFRNTTGFRANTFYIPFISKKRDQSPKEDSLDMNNSQSHDKVQFRTFASSRFFVAMFLMIMAIVNLVTFDFFLSGENHTGNWFALGGPSLFLPLGAPHLVVAILLLLYVLFSTGIISITNSTNLLHVGEFRLVSLWMTEIPKEKIKAIRLTNTKMGAKYLWGFVLGAYIIWVLVDGFHFLLSSFAFGNGILAGTYYLISGGVMLLGLLILVTRIHTFLEIVTEDKRYELQFVPPAGSPNLIFDLEAILGMNIEYHKSPSIDQVPEDNKTQLIHPTITGKFRDWTQFGWGLVFLFFGGYSQATRDYLGDMVSIPLMMFGLVYLIRGLREDFASKQGFQLAYTSSHLLIRRQFLWMKETYLVRNCHVESWNLKSKFKTLNFFDILMILLVIVLGMDFGGLLKFVPYESTTSVMYFRHIGLDVLILVGMLMLLLRPQNSLEIKDASLQHDYMVPGINSIVNNLENSENHENNKNNIGQKGAEKTIFGVWNKARQNDPKTLLLRMVFLLGVFGISTLATLI